MIVNPLHDVDLNGKVLLIKEEIMKAAYRGLEHRLVRGTGGFGCNPTSIGRAVFTEDVANPNVKDRWNREDFAGWVSDEDAEAALVKFRVTGQPA